MVYHPSHQKKCVGGGALIRGPRRAKEGLRKERISKEWRIPERII